MTQVRCTLMRSGTSSGPYFLAADLPPHGQLRDDVLLRIMGSPDPRQIDGLGGATTVTSKVAIVSPSERPGVDVEYLFAQVEINEARVDWSPTCGNMLTGVGPFAIERGLVEAGDGETLVSVYSVNTDSMAEVLVQTPGGVVQYEGDTEIAGVPGTAAPIDVTFHGVTHKSADAVFASGPRVTLSDGLEVSCVSAIMPCVLARASDFGVTGHESAAELSAMSELVARIGLVRVEVGELMGIDNPAESVIPKFVLVSSPSSAKGHLSVRYFTPKTCHPAMAVSGAVSVAAAAVYPGTIAHEFAVADDRLPHTVEIDHPSGTISTRLQFGEDGPKDPRSATVIRTVRPLLDGHVRLPPSLDWDTDS